MPALYSIGNAIALTFFFAGLVCAALVLIPAPSPQECRTSIHGRPTDLALVEERR